MTVEEIKSEAAKLPPDDRYELVKSIAQSADLRELRRAALVREIKVGLQQLDSGEFVECQDNEELQRFFDGVKTRGREMLNARNKSAA